MVISFKEDSGFNKGLSKLIDTIWLNLITFVCCIPIITIGASLTAMYTVLLKSIKDEEGYISKMFFKAFKDNFKQATKIWILMFSGICFVFCDIKIAGMMKIAAAELFFKIILIVIIIGTIYVFPTLARYENSVKNTIKNSYIYAVSALPKTIFIFVINIIPMLACYNYGIVTLYFIICGLAGMGYMSTRIFITVFEKCDEIEKNEI